MTNLGLALIKLVQKINISPLFLLITACSFQSLIPSPDKATGSTKNMSIQCLNKIAESIQSKPELNSLPRPSAPDLLRIHGSKENNSMFQPHIIIQPNGLLIRQLPDSGQAYPQATEEPLNTSGLHIQINGESNLPLDMPIPDDQYEALAVQLAIWQLKYNIPDSHITTDKPSPQQRTTHDLQMRLDWEKLQSHKDILTERCLLTTDHQG